MAHRSEVEQKWRCASDARVPRRGHDVCRSTRLSPSLYVPREPHDAITSPVVQPLTNLLMVTSRLLNDLHGYQKEEKQGKLNFVLLYLKENPEANIEDSINFVQLLLDQLNKEFLRHVLEELCDLPEPSRHLHLACFKVFHMFYNSSNRYDSDTDMLHDIQKALVVPPRVPKLKPLRPLPQQPRPKSRVFVIKSPSGQFGLERFSRKSFIGYQMSSQTSPVNRWENMCKPSSFKLCFV